MNLRTLLDIAALCGRSDRELNGSSTRIQKTPKSKEQQEKDIEAANLKRQAKNLKRSKNGNKSQFKNDPVLSEKLIGKPSTNPVSTVEVVDTTPDYRKRYEDE